MSLLSDETRGDENDDLRALLALSGVTEEGADNGDVSKDRHLFGLIGLCVSDQTTDSDGLARLNSEVSVYSANGHRRVSTNGSGRIADLGLKVQVQCSTWLNESRELERDAGVNSL